MSVEQAKGVSKDGSMIERRKPREHVADAS